MAKFEGKSCDNCGGVMKAADATTRTVRWTGPGIDHEVEEDLCSECITEDSELSGAREAGTLRPVRRRKRSDEPDAPEESQPATGAVRQ